MDRDHLAAQLQAGRSIESIARDLGRPPSTVAYWVSKYGLASAHAARHAPRGSITREQLEALVEDGLSTRAIADQLGVSQATVRHWLAKHGLETIHATNRRGDGDIGAEVVRICAKHGRTVFTRCGTGDSYRCLICRKQRVIDRRRKVKEILVQEAGGGCAICGYDRYAGALQFHHLDPATKAFGLGLRGIARSLERCREEAAKCMLLCANCHAEVEGGVATLPASLAD